MKNSEIILTDALNSNFTNFDIDDSKMKVMIMLEITKKCGGYVVKSYANLFNNHFCEDDIELAYYLKGNFDRKEYTIM
jgi:hypothetical protein